MTNRELLHQQRTNIGVIIGAVQSLLEMVTDGSKEQDFLFMIKRNAVELLESLTDEEP